MAVEFDGPELVLGGFRSVRGFKVFGGSLTSIIHNGEFKDSEQTYLSKCGRGVNYETVVHRHIEYKFGNVDFRNLKIEYIIDASSSPDLVILRGSVSGNYNKVVPTSAFGDKCFSGYCDSIVDTTLRYEHVEIPYTKFAILASRTYEHASPDKHCTCGFYSFYGSVTGQQKEDAWERFGVKKSDYVAVVENYGRVIHGSLGLRAEKMKILGLTPNVESFYLSGTPKQPGNFKMFNSEQELFEAFPPDANPFQ